MSDPLVFTLHRRIEKQAERGCWDQAKRDYWRIAMADRKITKEEAILLGETGWWERCDSKTAVVFQLEQRKLCMPFRVFHEKLEEVCGRPVWTHEMGLNWEGLLAEAKGEAETPRLAEIMDLVPEEKRLIFVAPTEERDD